jgi:tryptophan synthase alpha chain
MNTEINNAIERIKKTGRIGFMGHVIAGYPNYSSSLEAAIGICQAETDFLEVQFPFSDPAADGPVIESACYEAINKGFTVDRGFKLIKDIHKHVKTPILIMTYANIIFKYGLKKFIEKAKEADAAGLIIPDLPVENDEGMNELCRAKKIANIMIAAPGASEQRVRQLSAAGSGFLYTVARRGITGEKSVINKDAEEWFKLVRANSKLPLAIGFGIRTYEQIKSLEKYCEIAIVGSHLVEIIKKSYEKGLDIRRKLKKATNELLGN